MNVKNIVIILLIAILSIQFCYTGFYSTTIESFYNFDEKREKSLQIKEIPDNYDKRYVRFSDIIGNKPELYRADIINIKDNAAIHKNSVLLDAGCGSGKHFQIIKELYPDIAIEGVDRSKSMIERARIRNPGDNFICISLSTSELYKKNLFSHILFLHDAIHLNSQSELGNVLTNFNKWLTKKGHLAVHILNPTTLDPGPRQYSQYFIADDGTRHSLTYFESFTHEAWWEKIKHKENWYRYCEKIQFPKEKIKIFTKELWIPPVGLMIKYIIKHNFKLKKIIDLSNLNIEDFNMYIFQKT